MYPPLNGWTKEKIIQAIQTHNTGEKSIGPRDTCSYFSLDSDDKPNRCAVGCFIPDELKDEIHKWETTVEDWANTDPKKDDTTVIGLLATFPELKDKMPLCQEALIKLQGIHDRQDGGDPRPALIAWIEENVA